MQNPDLHLHHHESFSFPAPVCVKASLCRWTTALSPELDQLLTAETPPEGISMRGVGRVELLFHLLLLIDLEPQRPTVAQRSRGPPGVQKANVVHKEPRPPPARPL